MPSRQHATHVEMTRYTVCLLFSPIWGCFKNRRVSHESTAEHGKRCRLTRNRNSTGDQHRMRPLSELVLVRTLSCSPYRHACFCTAAHLTAITNDGFRQSGICSCRSQLLRQIPIIFKCSCIFHKWHLMCSTFHVAVLVSLLNSLLLPSICIWLACTPLRRVQGNFLARWTASRCIQKNCL